MSGELGSLALGTVGAGCSAAGLILWLAPRGLPARIATCVAGGVGLAGLLAATGLDTVEERLGRWGDARLWELRDGPWELPLALLAILVGLPALGASLGASFLWLGEAFEGKNKSRRGALACASVGAFGWAMTVLHVYGFFGFVWSSDLGPSLPPRGVVEAGLTILDMTGLVAALSLAPRPRR